MRCPLPKSNAIVPLSSQHMRGGGNSSTRKTGDEKARGKTVSFAVCFSKLNLTLVERGWGSFKRRLKGAGSWDHGRTARTFLTVEKYSRLT